MLMASRRVMTHLGCFCISATVALGLWTRLPPRSLTTIVASSMRPSSGSRHMGADLRRPRPSAALLDASGPPRPPCNRDPDRAHAKNDARAMMWSPLCGFCPARGEGSGCSRRRVPADPGERWRRFSMGLRRNAKATTSGRPSTVRSSSLRRSRASRRGHRPQQCRCVSELPPASRQRVAACRGTGFSTGRRRSPRSRRTFDIGWPFRPGSAPGRNGLASAATPAVPDGRSWHSI